MGGVLFFCPKTGKSKQFPDPKYSKVNKCPILGIFFSDLVDNAPNRGYNVITVKENKAKLPETGRRIKQEVGYEIRNKEICK